MTRQDLLDYIIDTHGADLEAAGVALADTPTALYYVLYDAMLYAAVSDDRQREVADAKITQLIADRVAANEEAPTVGSAMAELSPEQVETTQQTRTLIDHERGERFKDRVMAQDEQLERVLVDPRAVEE